MRIDAGETRRTRRQLASYVAIGGLQLCADWACFVALTWLGIELVPANVCARILGAVLGFWLNGRFTFAEGRRGHLGPAQASRFVVSWLVMALLSTMGVWLVGHAFDIAGARLAKPFIDAGLAGLGFLASKFWIYR